MLVGMSRRGKAGEVMSSFMCCESCYTIFDLKETFVIEEIGTHLKVYCMDCYEKKIRGENKRGKFRTSNERSK